MVTDYRPLAQPLPWRHSPLYSRDSMAQLYPKAPGTHFSCILQPAMAAVGMFFSPVTCGISTNE